MPAATVDAAGGWDVGGFAQMMTLRQVEVIRAVMVTGTIGGAAKLLERVGTWYQPPGEIHREIARR